MVVAPGGWGWGRGRRVPGSFLHARPGRSWQVGEQVATGVHHLEARRGRGVQRFCVLLRGGSARRVGGVAGLSWGVGERASEKRSWRWCKHGVGMSVRRKQEQGGPAPF